MHKTIAAFTDDLERFRFNRAVARIHELANAIGDFAPADAADRWACARRWNRWRSLIQPMMPHLAEELWERLGGTAWLQAAGPRPIRFSPGRGDHHRRPGQRQVARRRSPSPAIAKRQPPRPRRLPIRTSARLGEKTPRKVIVVPNKVINVVV